MLQKYLYIFLFILLSGSALASGIDSIGVENLEGKQLILHRISPKESYYSLGRKYGVNPAAIIAAIGTERKSILLCRHHMRILG